MRSSFTVGLLVASTMAFPTGCTLMMRVAHAQEDAAEASDPSLSTKGNGCVWKVPALAAPAAKKGARKRARVARAERVVLADVPCNNVKLIALRADGHKAAITVAKEGLPSSVETTPGNVSMVYPLSYRMFEADLATGKVSEIGLPKLKFPGDTRPSVALGYNRRDALIIAASGLGERDGTTLRRFLAGRRGWVPAESVSYKTDSEQDADDLCGDYVIHAALVKDLVNWCVKQ